MQNDPFDIKEAKQTDIVEYLEKSEYQPQKIRNIDYWYLSPLREEKEASFKVSRTLNLWYDHGLGKGGSLIDFGILYHNCLVPEFIQILSKSFSFHRKTLTGQQPGPNAQKATEALEPKIKVIAAKLFTSPTLCRYLSERKIPFEIAEKYCKEVHYELYDKRYFAIGFENRSGGFELRNPVFKGSSSPKDITLINSPSAKNISVFEGFFSFLSFKTLEQKDNQLTNFLVLNSLSFLEKSWEMLDKYQKVNLYLDQDEAGKKYTQTALQWNQKYTDHSHLYKDHKDLNDYLIIQSQQLNQSGRQRQHL